MKYLILTASLFASIVSAGTSTGNIQILGVNAFNQSLILAGTITDAPICATFNRFALDITSESGKAMYSLAVTAQAQNKKIRIVGQNNCNIRGDAESVQYLEIVI